MAIGFSTITNAGGINATVLCVPGLDRLVYFFVLEFPLDEPPAHLPTIDTSKVAVVHLDVIDADCCVLQ